MLESAFNELRYFIRSIFTLPHIPHLFDVQDISILSCYRAVHSEVRQSIGHSIHGYFIAPRPITTRPPLVRISCRFLMKFTYGSSQSTSASSTNTNFLNKINAVRSLRQSPSRRYPLI